MTKKKGADWYVQFKGCSTGICVENIMHRHDDGSLHKAGILIEPDNSNIDLCTATCIKCDKKVLLAKEAFYPAEFLIEVE